MANKENDGMSRRNFLKTGVFAMAGVMTAGVMSGCGKGRTANVRKDKEGGLAAGEEPAFMKAPEPIADSAIKETKETDVVVVGAGMSGLCAAVSAAESGAKVMVIEKGPTINFRSYDYGAVNSKLQLSVGNQLNPLDVTREIMRWGGYKAD
ncbi:MAG: FAD-dependent oxidoreductase, partial [Selenomonas sp.]|nr:FAD-dependent oxidoreductase [Selenomonas sp.]